MDWNMSGDHNMNQTTSGWRKRQIALDIKAKNAKELGLDYERGFVDGMQKQMQSSVDKAVNALAQPEQEQDAFKAAYIEAMIASNEAGFAGMTAAETIRELSCMVSEQLKPHTT
jgi:hypothetical protein